MVTITIDSSCTITAATADYVAQIKNALTIDNPAYKEAVKMGRYSRNIDRHLSFYLETEKGLEVPRGFTGEVIKILDKKKFIDNRRSLEPVNFEFTGQLRPYQDTAVENILKFDFGILEAPTGSGKTVMACAVIAARKQPTMIVVHSKELLYQWRDRIRQFLGIETGLIGDKHFNIKPVTVAIVNSALKHLDELPQHWGQLVIDECHRAPAKTFTDVVSAFDCMFMMGLTATLYRRDGLDKVVNCYLGRTAHTISKHHLHEIGAVLKPNIKQIETDFKYWYQDDYSKMLTAMTKDNARNTQVVNEAIKHSDNGTTLLVSDRVNHCQVLAALLSARGQKPAILTGKTPKKQRLQIVNDVQAGKVEFLISTLSLISEGFDCSGLCTLVMATPVSFKGRITQAVGRILRPGKDKRPLVIDFADDRVGVLQGGAKKRLRILNSL